MCILLISIWFIIGAMFARNHYLSIQHPKGCYYKSCKDSALKTLFYASIVFFMPWLISITVLIRTTGWNWRDGDGTKEHRSFKNII